MTAVSNKFTVSPNNPDAASTPNNLASLSLTSGNGKVNNKDEGIIALVRPAFDEIGKSIQSREDIIPYLLNETVKVQYQKHGERLLDYLDHKIELANMRAAAKQAYEDLERETPFKFPVFARVLAAGKSGKGECSEKSNAFVIKCMALGIECFLLQTQNHPIATPAGPRTKAHAFVLLDMNAKDVDFICDNTDKMPFLALIKRASRGILADPLLKILCPLKELSTTGANFVRYLTLSNTVWLNQVFPFPQDRFSLGPIIENETTKIYDQMRSILRKKGPIANNLLDTDAEDRKAEVVKLIRKDIFEELTKLAKRCGLEIQWHKNLKLGKFWIEGTEAEVLLVKEKLQKLGIEMKIAEISSNKEGKKQYAAFLENPSLSQLRRINAPETALTSSSNASGANGDKVERKGEKKGN